MSGDRHERLFAVELRHGPEWIPERGTREQPLWDEHAEFMDGLLDRGTIVLGGPLDDEPGTLLIMRVPDEATARELLAVDPWSSGGRDILRVDRVRPWTIYLDSRQSR
ncbi:MAG TPA: YciI family protein [Gaiellaceae bacterium]|nr:YciI family protein [Gaiellaceae bacterium]